MSLVLLQVVNKRGIQALQDTIAVVFDFDDTLAPDTTSSFLESLGVDVKEFWSRRVQGRIEAGWDPVPADYGSKSALSNSLTMAVESIANKITLRRTSYQG
jgi:hypothetical protein